MVLTLQQEQDQKTLKAESDQSNFTSSMLITMSTARMFQVTYQLNSALVRNRTDYELETETCGTNKYNYSNADEIVLK